ncbi:MAG TPA: hypothetical protein VIL26_04355 [Clostridia bacterium]
MKKEIPKSSLYLFGGKSVEELIQEIRSDYQNRRNQRRKYELQWQLNMNFVLGNQYCDIASNGEIQDCDKQFFWQERQVYNHLAPILETRLAKLNRVRPVMSVVPATDSDSDIYTAKVSSMLLNSIYHKNDLSRLISQATVWSETCGTVFYKIGWDKNAGKIAGKLEDGTPVYQGDISITVVPPFEIYPDYLNSCEVEDCQSLIHARACEVDYIKDTWGITVSGEDVNVFGLYQSEKNITQTPKKHSIVIEFYQKPTKQFPKGRLIIITQDKLLHIGELPYNVGAENTPAFPFVKQTCTKTAGSFFGISIIERAIPVQRSYNAVKNRKAEFLNRLAAGVLAVEDGAVDIDELTEDGLPPGKIVVYRQGANPPVFMDTGRLPSELNAEEDRIMSEFISISGVSEIMRNSQVPNSVSSGVGLQLLIEQDDTRLSMSAEFIRDAIKSIAKMILRIYREYSNEARVLKIVGENGDLETYYWKKSDLNSDDVVFASENELNQTPANKRSFVFDLLKTGILADENGKISNRMRHKILEMLGLGIYENARDIDGLHIKQAQRENLALLEQDQDASEIDNHELHIEEHIKYMLSDGFSKKDSIKERFLKHIRHHKAIMSLSNKGEINE